MNRTNIVGKVISLQKIKLKRMGHHQLDSLDEQILRLIASNARIPFSGSSPCLQCIRCSHSSAYSEIN